MKIVPFLTVFVPTCVSRNPSLGENKSVMKPYKIFISHGSCDSWVAEQIANAIHTTGALSFLDEKNIPKGQDFKKRIYEEIKECDELVVLITPWSLKRSWLWIEIGAAWIQDKPVVAVFYGVEPKDLEESGQGKAVLEDINIVEINGFDVYVKELTDRIREVQL